MLLEGSLERKKENLEFHSVMICNLYGLPLGLILWLMTFRKTQFN